MDYSNMSACFIELQDLKQDIMKRSDAWNVNSITKIGINNHVGWWLFNEYGFPLASNEGSTMGDGTGIWIYI